MSSQSNFHNWISAARPRTLPLALSTISMGGFLSAAAGQFNLTVFLLCCLTASLLQILSNLANDYGDHVHGADHAGRTGPSRSVQSGKISVETMKKAVYLTAILSLLSGLSLLFTAFPESVLSVLFWTVIGLLSIGAAITYTSGSKPYGYIGLGDLSVFIFFGLVGVLGSRFVISGEIILSDFLPSISVGLLAVAVLNVNNVRDIESDRLAGKFSIPVRIGRKNAAIYHMFLLGISLACASLHIYLSANPWVIFLILTPLFFKISQAVKSVPDHSLDPWLKKMAITTLIFVLLFGAGLLLGK